MKKKSTIQKAMALIKGIEPTYTEKSDIARREEVALLLTESMADFDAGMDEINAGAKCLIRGANKVLEAGRKADLAEKAGQKEFNFFATTVEGWGREHERKLKFKAAIKIYEVLGGKKVENMEQAQPGLHQLWILSGQIKALHRTGKEKIHGEVNPFSAFISAAASVETWLKQLEPADSPMEAYYAGCDTEKLQHVEAATKPIAERHAIVTRLLQAKG